MEPLLATPFALNPQQQAAVEHRSGPLLVVAGAGTGKTRVLTARVARLVADGVAPSRILAFTFTNRAAREMRERLARVLGGAATEPWVGTFHATAVRILRREAPRMGLAPGFVIYDREDQEEMVREVVAGLERPGEAVRPGEWLARISDAKNALVTPEEMARLAVSPAERRVAEVYAGYQARLRACGALDFDDLIAETVRLLRDHEEAARAWQRRFDHVLVDEYQDTNHAQFRLVHALSAGHRNLFVVGDDDQSIYAWRGADLANLLDFERAFPGARVVRLEQNYRSTGTILRAANAVISNNAARKGKTLWSELGDGEPIRFALSGDEVEEAGRIRRFLAEHTARGGRLSDCAVLYRTNAQSRAIEVELRRHLVPYEVVGGVAFYQRREVKDLLAYLRLALNPADEVSFWRAWNTPRRGLGPAVRTRVEQRMREAGGHAVGALRAVAAAAGLPRPAAQGAAAFLALLDDLAGRADQPVDRLLMDVLERTGYLESLEGEDNAAERRANLEELVASAGVGADGRVPTLAEFLAESALTTDADRVDAAQDRVLLMTAHNAKGLEFDVVVVAGLEEGLMPHGASMADGPGLEEERRLFYVALTRARQRVLLTAAAFRRRFDGARGGRVSRFVDEIPGALLAREEAAAGRPGREDGGARWGGGARGRVADDAEGLSGGPAIGWMPPAPVRRSKALGRVVFHESFGRGVVVEAEGEGADARYTVRFGTQLKRVLGRFLSGGDHDDPA